MVFFRMKCYVFIGNEYKGSSTRILSFPPCLAIKLTQIPMRIPDSTFIYTFTSYAYRHNAGGLYGYASIIFVHSQIIMPNITYTRVYTIKSSH